MWLGSLCSVLFLLGLGGVVVSAFFVSSGEVRTRNRAERGGEGLSRRAEVFKEVLRTREVAHVRVVLNEHMVGVGVDASVLGNRVVVRLNGCLDVVVFQGMFEDEGKGEFVVFDSLRDHLVECFLKSSLVVGFVGRMQKCVVSSLGYRVSCLAQLFEHFFSPSNITIAPAKSEVRVVNEFVGEVLGFGEVEQRFGLFSCESASSEQSCDLLRENILARLQRVYSVLDLQRVHELERRDAFSSLSRARIWRCIFCGLSCGVGCSGCNSTRSCSHPWDKGQ